MAVVLLAGSSAFGEFLVQPIIFKQAVRPGRRIPLDLKLTNTSPDTTETVSLRLAELTQNEDGVWQEVRLDDPNNPVDASSLRSCKGWLTCGVDSVQLDPLQISPIPMIAQIPAGTRGFYFAALIAETAPRETADNVMMRVQYLVPIILEAQTIPLQAKVQLTGVHLTYREPTVEEPAAAVIASMDIENTGGTYSRLQGQIRIWHETRGRWQKAADLTLPDSGIIPGVKLNLKQDVGMLLPSGKYKLEGYLYVDGRRGNGVSEEIDFKGDPRKDKVQMLVPIDLDKENIFVDSIPGSTRMGTVLVGNASEERIKVNAEIRLPEHMVNVVSGQGVKGSDLGCADWATLQPEEFTLGKYGRRNLNLIVRMPAEATQYADYYATLRLHVTYPDGSPGGTKVIQVCVRNGRATSTNLISERSLNMAELSPSKYVVTAGFSNDGVTYVTPSCRGILTNVDGDKYKQFLMFSEAEGQRGILTPFETRTFSGTLDVSDLPTGYYRLTAVAAYDGQSAQGQSIQENTQSQRLVEVFEDGNDGHKTLRYAEQDKAPESMRGKVLIRL